MASSRARLVLIIACLPHVWALSDPPIRRLVGFVATDSKGHPVTDLRPDEIRVSDDGKPATLAFSRLIPLTLPTVAALDPGEFSNRSGNKALSSVLILVDLFNTNFPSDSNAFHALIEAVGKLEPSDNVYLFLLAPDATLLPVRDLPIPGAPVLALTPDLLRKAMNMAERRNRQNAGDSYSNAVNSQHALETLGAHYAAALPGQKRLIWMTRGMPLAIAGPKGAEPLVFQNVIQQTAEHFRQLSIPIYTASESFASLTGGRSFKNEAIAEAIAQARLDARATYLAAFDTAPGKSDGKLHQLRVSTTRKGIRILAPGGYIADPADNADQRALERAESQIFDDPDLALRASLSVEGITGHFRIQVDAGSILLAFVFLNSNGAGTATEPVRSTVNPGVPVTVDLQVPAGTNRVRIAAEDPATGATGTLTIPAQ